MLFRQKLQRLQNREREAERDLMRFHRELTQASKSSVSNQPFLSRQKTDLFRSQTPRLSISTDTNLTIQRPVRTKFLLGRPLSINTSRTTIDQFAPINPKQFSTNKFNERVPGMSEQTPTTKVVETRPYLQIHAQAIHQQNQEIEQKLKKFLH